MHHYDWEKANMVIATDCCTKTIQLRKSFISILKSFIQKGILISRVKCNLLVCEGKKNSLCSLNSFSAGRNWAVWQQQMSFALRRWEIIVLRRCYSNAEEMGNRRWDFFLRLDGFSAVPYWWHVSIEMVDDSSVKLASVKGQNRCVWEAGRFYTVCARDEWLVFIEERKASLVLSPVARLSHQMEGRVVVARLILSSGLRCNPALQAAGVVMRGWRRALRSILWWQGSSSAQAAVTPFWLIKTALRSASVMLFPLM